MREGAAVRRVVIMGAAGRDFHTFLMLYRDDPAAEVVAFTAAQIPGIAERRLPPSLAGPRYPDGIPIVGESMLGALCRERAVDEVAFAYSDVSHAEVMHKASAALAAGAGFVLPSPVAAMIDAPVPVVAVCAVRTGCGKSQVARHLSACLAADGRRVAVLRHPMPYGDLERQAVQRLASMADLAAAQCTVDEREEYEPHIRAGSVVFAGVDYRAIVRAAAREADLILWDGGNNDLPFVRPDVLITLVDPMRAGDEAAYHPGETALRMADIVLVAKSNTAPPDGIAAVEATARRLNPDAPILRGESRITLDDPGAVAGRRVLVIEDGPTITHGGMPHGAGHVAALAAGAADLIDPRPAAVGGIAAAYRDHPHIGRVLPALGYGPDQLADLERTVAGVAADAVIVATPCDLPRLITIRAPVVRARYDYADTGVPGLAGLVADRIAQLPAGR